MSQLQGIRNLKDLYSFKYAPDKLQQVENLSGVNTNANSSRLKLPSFGQTKTKLMLNNSGIQKKIKIKQQNSSYSQREPKIIQLQLGQQALQQGVQSANVSHHNSPSPSPHNQLSNSQYNSSRNSRREYNSIFNNAMALKNNPNNERASSRDVAESFNDPMQSSQQQPGLQMPKNSHRQLINRSERNSISKPVNQQQQQQSVIENKSFLPQNQQQQRDSSRDPMAQSSQNYHQNNDFFERYKASPFLNQLISNAGSTVGGGGGNSTSNQSQNGMLMNQQNTSTNQLLRENQLQSSQQEILLNSYHHVGGSSQRDSSLNSNSNNQSSNFQNPPNNIIIKTKPRQSRGNSGHSQKLNDSKEEKEKFSRNSEISPFTSLNAQGMTKAHFNYHYVIGKGGFGKVWKVDYKKNKQLFAMKEMSKSKIITKRSVNSVMSERHLLSQLKHPFLVNMNFAFQDRDNLYLVMDLLTGGDLRFHVGKHRRFKEVQTRFFVACIMVALEYLHNHNIIHRDIKPENLVLDRDGYVRVTDLGIARIWKPENSQDTSGTPGYMAPEVMCRQNHGIAVDYFALGVIAYEFMMGRRPYLGRSRKEIRDQILMKQVQIKKHEIPEGWSLEAADFINRMIQRKPQHRLGINGPDEVKSHPWLKNFPWNKLLNKEIDAPFVPSVSIDDNFDYRQQISLDGKDTQEELIQQNALLLRRNSVQNLFSGYNYDGLQKKSQILGQSTGSTNATNHGTTYTNQDKPNLSLIKDLDKKQQIANLLQQQQLQQQQQAQMVINDGGYIQ